MHQKVLSFSISQVREGLKAKVALTGYAHAHVHDNAKKSKDLGKVPYTMLIIKFCIVYQQIKYPILFFNMPLKVTRNYNWQ